MTDPGPAYLMLAHDGLPRAGRLAARLCAHGAPVAVHVDARADIRPFRAALNGAPIIPVRRRRTRWGGFGLVAATLDGLSALRASGRAYSHVLLLSGADLPLRPEEELRGFLADHPGTDFIESVDPDAAPWVRGGLSAERFTRRHPFDWRRHPRLFDAALTAQRRFGLTRPAPEVSPPLAPRLGSQWWCLSRESAAALLDAPDLPALARWFRLCWLPDESFFATLIPRVAARPPDPRGPLSFARFDPTGRPWLLYDDHAEALAASDFFFARKLWPAAGLDESFPRPQGHAGFAARPPAIPFAAVEARAAAPPRGLRHAGRAPLLRLEGEAALPRPLKLLVGLDRLWGPQILDWIAERADVTLHGRVFAPFSAPCGGAGPRPGGRFAHGAAIGPGGMPCSAALLREAPARMLSELTRATEGPPALALDPQDAPLAVAAAAEDPMAHAIVLRDAWALVPAAPEAEQARRAEAAERRMLDRISPARLTLLSPWEALAAPGPALRRALAAARIGLPRDDGAPPPPVPWANALPERLAALRAAGFDVAPAAG